MQSLERLALYEVNPIGKLYIKEVFPTQSKKDMQELVQYLVASYR